MKMYIFCSPIFISYRDNHNIGGDPPIILYGWNTPYDRNRMCPTRSLPIGPNEFQRLVGLMFLIQGPTDRTNGYAQSTGRYALCSEIRRTIDTFWLVRYVLRVFTSGQCTDRTVAYTHTAMDADLCRKRIIIRQYSRCDDRRISDHRAILRTQ